MLMIFSIIGILMVVGMFPYAEYMRRAALSNAVDTIAQEWILAHKEVRNGVLFSDDVEEKHAHLVIAFKKNSSTIQEYLLSGSELPTSFEESGIKKYKSFTLERAIQVQGSEDIAGDTIYYVIAPPFATGSFYDSNRELQDNKEIQLQIGYPGAQADSPGVKKILLRPYLQ